MSVSEPSACFPVSPKDGTRWSIWIDIEWFSGLWGREDGLAVKGLRALMSGIFAIGSRVYYRDGDRLFAHQFGDGFVIVADFHEPDLGRCAAIAVALMRYVARTGCLARAAIAEGEFADISGLWPREIRVAAESDNSDDVVRLGSGIMTLLPVMGSALINANKLDSRNSAKGALLTIATDNAARVPDSFPRQTAYDTRFTVIDWVHAVSVDLDEIATRSGLGRDLDSDLARAIDDYIAAHAPPAPWIRDTVLFNGLTS